MIEFDKFQKGLIKKASFPDIIYSISLNNRRRYYLLSPQPKFLNFYYIMIKSNFQNSQMVFKATLIYIFVSSCNIYAQIITNSNNIQLAILPKTSILPYTNSSSLNLANDNIRFVTATPTHLYALSTNNAVQIFSKCNTFILEANVTDYFSQFGQALTFQISMMVFDEEYNVFVLSAFYSSILRLIFYNTPNDSLPTYSYIVDSLTLYAYAPWTTFVANSVVYSFFSAAAQSDSLYCLRLSNNSTFTVALPTVNSSIAVSPDRRYGLVWTQYSQLYIYNVTNNFSLLYVYNDSVFNQKGLTQSIKFSSDSAMAILETDNHNPIQVIDLTDFSIPFSITVNKKINSAEFLDTSNRFILIDCTAFTYVYDTVAGTLATFNASLSATSLFVDQSSSQIIADFSEVFGVNATINGSIVFGNSCASPTPNNSGSVLNSSSNAQNSSNVSANSSNNSLSTPSISVNSSNYPPNSSNSPTNSSNNDMNSSSNALNGSNSSTPATINQSPPFSYPLNLSAWQNQTFAAMRSVSSLIEDMMGRFNGVIFSSPLACFFLGFFNYFVLSSLYVLLNMPLPDVVFAELVSVFASANASLLASLGLKPALSPLTDELVREGRALFFGVSSDLVSNDAYAFALVVFNVVLVEAVIALRRIVPKGCVFNHFLTFKRERIYFGLIVSVMVGYILPWKFITFNNPSNFKTKTNSFCYHTGFVLIIFFISVITFISVSSDTNINSKIIKGKKKDLRISKLPQWMIGLQNFLYPFLVLFSNPIYFLILILVSKATEVSIFIKNSKHNMLSKILQMGSFICEIIFHCTFFVFSYSKDQQLLIYSSIFCLAFFLLGAVLNFALVMVQVVLISVNFYKSVRKSNKITYQEQKRQRIEQGYNHKKIVAPTFTNELNITKNQDIFPSPTSLIKKKIYRPHNWNQNSKRIKKVKFEFKFEQRMVCLDAASYNQQL